MLLIASSAFVYDEPWILSRASLTRWVCEWYSHSEESSCGLVRAVRWKVDSERPSLFGSVFGCEHKNLCDLNQDLSLCIYEVSRIVG